MSCIANRGKVYIIIILTRASGVTVYVCSPHVRIMYSCGTKYWIENGDSERLVVVKGECILWPSNFYILI